jgi:hypothetical protein
MRGLNCGLINQRHEISGQFGKLVARRHGMRSEGNFSISAAEKFLKGGSEKRLLVVSDLLVVPPGGVHRAA